MGLATIWRGLEGLSAPRPSAEPPLFYTRPYPQFAPKSTPAKCTVSCLVVFASWRQRVLPPNARFLVQSYSSVGAKEYSHQMHGFLFSRIRQLAPKSTPAKYTVSCSVVFVSWRQRALASSTRFLGSGVEPAPKRHLDRSGRSAQCCSACAKRTETDRTRDVRCPQQ